MCFGCFFFSFGSRLACFCYSFLGNLLSVWLAASESVSQLQPTFKAKRKKAPACFSLTCTSSTFRVSQSLVFAPPLTRLPLSRSPLLFLLSFWQRMERETKWINVPSAGLLFNLHCVLLLLITSQQIYTHTHSDMDALHHCTNSSTKDQVKRHWISGHSLLLSIDSQAHPQERTSASTGPIFGSIDNVTEAKGEGAKLSLPFARWIQFHGEHWEWHVSPHWEHICCDQQMVKVEWKGKTRVERKSKKKASMASKRHQEEEVRRMEKSLAYATSHKNQLKQMKQLQGPNFRWLQVHCGFVNNGQRTTYE